MEKYKQIQILSTIKLMDLRIFNCKVKFFNVKKKTVMKILGSANF